METETEIIRANNSELAVGGRILKFNADNINGNRDVWADVLDIDDLRAGYLADYPSTFRDGEAMEWIALPADQVEELEQEFSGFHEGRRWWSREFDRVTIPERGLMAIQFRTSIH